MEAPRNILAEVSPITHRTASMMLDLANKIAAKILKNSPNAIRAAIRAVNANYKDGVDGMQVEIEEFGKCFGTPEFIEGTTAFLEKRKPNFKGE